MSKGIDHAVSWEYDETIKDAVQLETVGEAGVKLSANWDHGTFRTTLSWILSTEKGLIELQRYRSWVKNETIDVRHWRKLEYEVMKLSKLGVSRNTAYEGHVFPLPEKEIHERTWMSIGTISKSPHITKLAEQRELFAGIKCTSGGRAAIPLESELELCDIIEN
ncbi:hypothetical protein KY289_001602 [Solanum tuberosum]|nr:hypothetical protein KY289_001602 [Solanum tuberosum]